MRYTDIRLRSCSFITKRTTKANTEHGADDGKHLKDQYCLIFAAEYEINTSNENEYEA